jgi:hypothetical protein
MLSPVYAHDGAVKQDKGPVEFVSTLAAHDNAAQSGHLDMGVFQDLGMMPRR